MNDPSRRQFLQTASLAVAGAVVAAQAADKTEGAASMSIAAPAFAPIHQPKPLSFDSERLLRAQSFMDIAKPL